MPVTKQKQVKINVFHPGAPHEKQALVLDDPARFKLMRCGRKFGKTQLLTSWLMQRAITNYCEHHGHDCPSKLTYLYVAPSFKQGKAIVWGDHVERLLRHFDLQGLPYKKNETDLSVTFPSGGTFRVFGVENDEALRGPSAWGAIACDEYDDWGRNIWPLVIRPNLVPHKAPAFIAGTPKGKAGIYRMEMAENEVGEKIWSSYHFTSFENTSLPEDELNAVVSEYRSYGEDYYQQEIMAEYVKPIGVVYKEFIEKVQVSDRVKYNPSLPLHCTWDFGVNDPTVIIWLQPTPDGYINVIDYHEESDANIENFVQVVKSKGYGPVSVHTGDIAGRQRDLTSGTSVIDELKKHGIYVFTKSIPTVQDQIRKCHSIVPRLRVAEPPASARTAMPSERYTDTQRFIDVLTNYRYPERKAETAINQGIEKPIHNEYSHGARALEYYAWNIGTAQPQDQDEGPTRLSTGISKGGFYGT